jgi:hypothetical protein
MGYSIAVFLPTQEASDQMLTFLEAQPWEDIFRKQSYPYAELPCRGEDLGPYPPDKNRGQLLGFAGSQIPDYAWAVCAWVALQAGDKPMKTSRDYFTTKNLLLFQKIPIPLSVLSSWACGVMREASCCRSVSIMD